MQKHKILFSACIAAVLLMTVLLSACGSDTSSIGSRDFFLRNSDGTFTYGEIVFPEDRRQSSCPLVVMSHGIYGSMNSGGARLLSQMLAEHGIAAVRVDFNRCLTDDPSKALAKDKSGRTNEYTLSDMLESNSLAIDFAVRNFNADPDRIGLYGRSFGGRVAMIMGNENYGGIDYKAMALIAPAGNEYALIHYMGGTKKWNALMQAVRDHDVYDRNGLRFTAKWFDDYYRMNPALTGDGFGDKPVMVYYNTRDKVVEPKTSLECAHAYSNVRIYKVTTDDGHGYEMSYKSSEIKDEIMNRVVGFFEENLQGE